MRFRCLRRPQPALLALAAVLGAGCKPIEVQVTLVDQATRLEQEVVGSYQDLGRRIALQPSPAALGLPQESAAELGLGKFSLQQAVRDLQAALDALSTRDSRRGESRAAAEARLRYNLFSCRLRQGRVKEARLELAKAKRLARRRRLLDLMWKIQIEEALLAPPARRPKLLRQAADALFKTPLFLLHDEPTDRALRAALERRVVENLLAGKGAGEDEDAGPEAALNMVETFAALPLCIMMDRRGEPLGPAEARKLYEAAAPLRRAAIEKHRRLLLYEAAEGDPDSAKTLDRLAREFDQAVRDLARAVGEFDSIRFGRFYYFQPMDAADAQAELPDDAAYVRYYLAGRRLHAWVVASEAIAHAATDVDAAWLASVQRAAEDPLAYSEADVRRWSAAALKPIAKPLSGARRIYLAPGPALSPLPWPALRLGGKMLCERAQLAFEPHAFTFVLANEARKLFKRSVAFFPRETGDESLREQISRSFKRMTTLTEKKVTLEAVKSLLHSNDVAYLGPTYLLHFSRPWESYVAFNGSATLRRTRLRDLGGVDFTGQLLALAEVDGATFRSQIDEQPLDRTIDVLAAIGAPSIVAAMPAPGAKTPTDLWNAFFANFVTLPPGEALRRAQVAAAKAHPRGRAWTRLRLFGHLGLDKEQAEEFAEEAYGELLAERGAAVKAKDWPAVLRASEQAIELLPFLPSRQADRLAHEQTAAVAAFRALRFQDAVEHGRAWVRLLQQKGDKPALAEARFVLGIACSRAGEEYVAEAVNNVRQAMQLYDELGKKDQVLAKLTELAWIYRQAGDYEKCIQTFDQGLGLSRQLQRKDTEASLYRDIGIINFFNLNRYLDAEKYFQKAYDAAKQDEDDVMMAQCLIDMAIVRHRLGDFETAERRLKKALDMATEMDDAQLKAKAHQELANVMWFQARYSDAFAHLNAAMKIFDQLHNDRLKVAALNTRGLVYWTLNDYEKALGDFEDALALAQRVAAKGQWEMRGEISTTHNNIGLIFRDRGEYAKALEHFNASLKLDVAMGNKWGQAYSCKNLGMTYRRMGELAKAKARLEKAVALSRKIGDKTNLVKSLYSLGDVFFDLKDFKAAEKAYREAYEQASRIFVREIEWRSLWGLGRVAKAAGDLGAAYDDYKRAIEVVENMRAQIKVEEYRNGFVSNKLDLYYDMIRLLLDQGKTGEAFEYSERSRGRSFIDLLGNHAIRVSNPKDQKLLDRQRRLRVRIREAEETLKSAPDAKARRTAKANLLKLKKAYRDLIIEIKAANPQLSSFVTVNPITLEEAKKLISGDVALAEYLVAPHEVIVWVLRRGRISVVRTPIKSQADLRGKVLKLRKLIQGIEDLEGLPEQLYQILFAGVRGRLGGARYVCIVPHGVLHYLPFGMLYDGEDYMVDRYALFYSPSASVLRFTMGKKRRARDKKRRLRVLAIGNPDLGNPALALPFAEKEVHSIPWSFPQVDILTGKQATESALLKRIGDYDIIHIASHGEFDSVNPLFSALLLARDQKLDGRLEYTDVFQVRMNAELIVLSACQTGLGKVEAGDEVIGLTRAFTYAGTQAIISSLWRVSDVATGLLVKHFYRNYVHMNKADSLRQAQLFVKKRYPHPAYWAAFTLTGDYR